jgi:chaperonin cofactor prefoldin
MELLETLQADIDKGQKRLRNLEKKLQDKLNGR